MSDAPEDDLILPLYILATLIWMFMFILTFPAIILYRGIVKKYGAATASRTIYVICMMCAGVVLGLVGYHYGEISAQKEGRWHKINAQFTPPAELTSLHYKMAYFRYTDPGSGKTGYWVEYYKPAEPIPKSLPGWVSADDPKKFYTEYPGLDRSATVSKRIYVGIAAGIILGFILAAVARDASRMLDEHIALHKAKFAT